MDFTPSDEIDKVEIKIDGKRVLQQPKMMKHITDPGWWDESQTFSKMMSKLQDSPIKLRNSLLSSNKQTVSGDDNMHIRDFIWACQPDLIDMNGGTVRAWNIIDGVASDLDSHED